MFNTKLIIIRSLRSQPGINSISKKAENYYLILSLHCQQIFPKNLVKAIPCLNLHPGYNPYNRGWYPHVFSMIDGKPTGATLLQMDEYIDHGPIIDQKVVEIKSQDTSKEVYEKIYQLELEILEDNFINIINLTFTTKPPVEEGDLHFKKQYFDLLEIDLNTPTTYGKAINYLRAMTHGDYNNAFFIDKKGKKIYVKLVLEGEK